MRYLRWNGLPAIDFVTDPELIPFRSSLDAEMKNETFQSCGKGSTKWQAEPISKEDKHLLWKKGLLGDATPPTLVDTMIFYNGINFVLQSGDEHWQLRLNSSHNNY